MIHNLIIYKNRDILTDSGISDILKDAIQNHELDIFDTLAGWFGWCVKSIGDFISTAVSQIQTIVNTIVTNIIAGTNGLINSVINTTNNIYSLVQNIPNLINNAISAIQATIRSLPSLSQIMSSLPSLNQIMSSLPSLATITSGVSNLLSPVTALIKSLPSISQISSAITSGISGIGTAISGLPSAIVSALNSSFTQINSAIQGLGTVLITQLTPVLNQLGSVLNAIGTQIMAGVKTNFDAFTASLNDFINRTGATMKQYLDQINASLSKFSDTIIAGINKSFKTVTDAFSSFEKTLGDSLTKVIGTLTSQFDSFVAYLSKTLTDAFGAFGKTLTGLLAPVTKWINDALTAFFTSDFWLKTIKPTIELPKAIEDFFISGSKFLDKITESHSPSILDNIGTVFSEIVQLMLEGPITYWGIKSFTGPDTFKPLTDWLQGLGKALLPGLQEFAKEVSQGFTDLANFIVDGIITTFNLPKPDSNIKDPFGKMFNSLFHSFENLAKITKTKTPIVTEVIMNVVSEVAGTLIAGESLEWAGLAIDASHPIKNWQLREKFKNLVDKIGLGHVTGVVGATLVAASLAPALQRFWNKQSQVRLVDTGSLIEMWHRDQFTEKILDEYLSEHGYDERFRVGLKENFLKIPSFDKIIDAYLRFMIEGKIDRTKMESELTSYLKVFDLKDVKRSFASFSEKDLVGKLIYRFLSRFERRSLNAIGLLDEKTATDILTADRVRPDLIPKLVTAERLQGSLTFRNKIESKITERVTKGFELPDTFGATMLKIEYGQSAIDYLVQANKLDIQTTIDEARLKEVDQNYTNAFIEKTEYSKTVADIIKNPDIAKEHIAISDITRKRTDLTRVRDEGNLAVSYELVAFAQGAVTPDEFEEVAAAMGKKPDEIETLEYARNILLDNKTRMVKFGTLQYLLAKRQITRDQFIAHSTILKIDGNLSQATADKIIAQSLTKAKTAKAVADENIFKLYPSLP